jgi:hypothetical protein
VRLNSASVAPSSAAQKWKQERSHDCRPIKSGTNFGTLDRRSSVSNPQSPGDTMNGQAQPYQPLTSENAALVLVDHQVGLMTGVRDYSTGELKHNVVALAKAAKQRRQR